jgi:hypothetical protein
VKDLYKDCTLECEREATCTVCGQRKNPIGRSAPLAMNASLCDWECDGYREDPRPPHLWPGELASIRADEGEEGPDGQ